MEKGISLVILAYKEEDNLRALFPDIIKELEECGEPYEILIIDSEEPLDNTEEVCKEYGARYINQEEPFFGGAFRTGKKHAKKDKFLIMDADGSHPPKYIKDIYKMFVGGGYDIVIGSRYVDGGVSNDTFASKTMSHVLNLAYRTVIGVKARDLSTDYRMYHTADLKRVKLKCLNYDVLEEVLMKIKILKEREGNELMIGEVPISFDKRRYGESKRRLLPFIISYAKTLLYLLRLRMKG